MTLYAVWIPTPTLGQGAGALATCDREVIVGTQADMERLLSPGWELVPMRTAPIRWLYPMLFSEVEDAPSIDQAREGLPRAEASGLLEAEVGPDQQRRPDPGSSQQNGAQVSSDQA